MATKVYLDYNATTPLHSDLLPHVRENLTRFGNSSSVHWAGRESKALIFQAREAIAKYLHCDPMELVFTSGGSEGNNLILKGFAKRVDPLKNEIVCSEVEHPSVLKTVEYLEAKGYKIKWIKVSREGAIDLEGFEKLLSEQTALVTCQLVNNETGNVFPIKKMAKIAKKYGALFHSDMVQSLGKIPVDLTAMDVDFATFAGHKFYALKGAAVVYIRKGLHVDSLILGGAQERNRRAGTENALAIASFGDAIKILGPRLEERAQFMTVLRDKLQQRVLTEISGTRVNGLEGKRVPNTLNVTFEGVDGETLLINLDIRGFAISSGAACSSGSQEPSPVLMAMGLSPEEASQSLRISMGWLTTEEEVDSFFINLKESVAQMRQIHSAESVESEMG